MKRLARFSVAAMLAMGVSAGATAGAAAPCVSTYNAASQMQAEQAFKALCEKYGVTAEQIQKAKDCKASASKPSTKPENPVTPETPTTPEKPVTPETPTTPEKPVTPETPTTPDKPVTPETPTTPDKPVTPETPETPDASETPSDSSFAAQVVSLVNAERAKQGLSALKIDSKVTAAAQTRAGEIKTSFAHTRPDGRSFSTALQEAGAAYSGAGENIAYGQSTPEAVMHAWMNSEGHRANIMNNKYTSIGVGYAVIGGTAYWTQLFTY